MCKTRLCSLSMICLYVREWEGHRRRRRGGGRGREEEEEGRREEGSRAGRNQKGGILPYIRPPKHLTHPHMQLLPGSRERWSSVVFLSLQPLSNVSWPLVTFGSSSPPQPEVSLYSLLTPTVALLLAMIVMMGWHLKGIKNFESELMWLTPFKGCW